MAVAMVKPEDSYLIVVVGAMNAAIHHPSWYSHPEVGILRPDEAEIAVKGSAILCTAQLAQFEFGSLKITCDPIRWQIYTESGEAVARAIEVAEKTFRILQHTPVTAFGFNFLHHRQTRLPKVNKTLSRLVRGLPIGIVSDPNESAAAKLNYQHAPGGGKVITVQIEPSVNGDEWIYVAINIEYKPFPPGDGSFRFFNLDLNDLFAPDREHADRQLQGIVDAVNHLEEN